jgi:hypothetical protein
MTDDPRYPVRCAGGGRWVELDGRPQEVLASYDPPPHWPAPETKACGWAGNSHGPVGTEGWVPLTVCPVCGGRLDLADQAKLPLPTNG